MVLAHLAVAWVLGDVGDPQHAPAAESEREARRRARLSKILERLAGRAGQRVQRERFTLAVAYRIKERAELCAGELRRGVGHRLHQILELEFGGEGGPRLVQDFENALLFLELFRDLQ
jgi:hypothetical protein